MKKNTIQHIRRLKAAELPQARVILRDVGVFTKLELRDIMNSIKYYVYKPSGEESVTYVYEIDGKVAGFISFGRELGKKTYEISALAVSPSHQRKGVAKKLLEFAEKKINSWDGRLVCVSTSSTRHYNPARRLYRLGGYVHSASVKDYFDDGDNLIIYSKRLKTKTG